MKRFWKHFFYMLFFVPLVVFLLLLARCAVTYEVVDQYGLITKSTTAEANGTVFMQKYSYSPGHADVTIEYYENDALVGTEERQLPEDDPLLRDTFEVLPHPTATAARSDREENGSHVTIRYYDAEGNAEGYSELVYNTWDRLASQKDYDTEGNLLRTTSREFAGHTVSRSSLS